MNRRGYYLLVAVLVFILGVASRRVSIQNVIWEKYLGDALYAALFYLCLAVCWPNGTARHRAIATSVFVVCVECFQLTGIPMDWRKSESWFLEFVSVLLGTKFGWLDMLSYFVGISATLLFDIQLIARGERLAPIEGTDS